tara:strand:- start:139 stop:321 length:183 start_codon:yes stop_codon:yes gene_type:complete
MKEYTCEIKLHFVGNNREANNIEEYKKLIVEQYQEEYGIALDEKEIQNIVSIPIRKDKQE